MAAGNRYDEIYFDGGQYDAGAPPVPSTRRALSLLVRSLALRLRPRLSLKVRGT